MEKIFQVQRNIYKWYKIDHVWDLISDQNWPGGHNRDPTFDLNMISQTHLDLTLECQKILDQKPKMILDQTQKRSKTPPKHPILVKNSGFSPKTWHDPEMWSQVT